MNKIKIVFVLFILLCSVVVITIQSAPHPDHTIIEIIPSEYFGNFTEPNLINLSIYVTPQNNTLIDTVAIELLYFTPNTLQCEKITWGNLFEDSIFQLKGTINNTAGTIRDIVWGSTIPTLTPGYFVNMTFNITAPGLGYIRIDKAGVARSAEDLPLITSNFSLDTRTLWVSNEYPTNRSKDLPVHLLLEVDIYNALSEPMNLHFYSNVTSEWKMLDQLIDLNNGRYSTSTYGVIHSPYNQELQYLFGNRVNNTYTANTCSGKCLGAISKVEIYTPSFSGTIQPIFMGMYDGDEYIVSGSTHTDITEDNQAPTIWTWNDVKNLQLYTTSSTTAYVIVTYDLGYGEGERVDWSVNLTDGSIWVNESYWYVTEIKSPIISNPTPRDAGTWDYYYPTLSVDVYDPNGDVMNVSFYWLNELEEWEQLGVNQTGGNGTYYQTTNFANYSKLYYWRVVVVDVDDNIVENIYRFRLRDIQDASYDFISEKYCYNQVNLSWVKPEHVDYTRIQRRTDRYPMHPYDGLNVYNGTASEFDDVFVTPGTLYFYSAWSWNVTDGTWSEEFNYSVVITSPDVVTDFFVETVDYQTVNLYWTKGINAETTIIRRKTGSYPSHPLEGILVYEGNGTSFTDTGLGGNITYYYRAWAQYWDIVDITSGSGTWIVPDDVTSIDVLVVAGGGGSGRGTSSSVENAGGGGAGGLIWMPFYPVIPNDSISYSIGSGGAGSTSYNDKGNNGGDTVFGNITAKGGGGGGSVLSRSGASGGSGGGAGVYYTSTASGGDDTQRTQASWSGVFGYGNKGANSVRSTSGGGGGAGGSANGIQGGIGIDMSPSFGINWGYNGVFSSGGGAHNYGVDAVINAGMGGRARGTTSNVNGRSGSSGIVLIRYSSQQIIDVGVLNIKTKFEEGTYDFYSCEPAEGYNTTEVGPPSVQTKPASNIDDYSATLNALLLSDGGEPTTVGFLWQNESGIQNTTIGVRTTGQSFNLNIYGLNIGTTYSFKAWAKNDYGYVEGDEQFFNTRPYPPTNLSIFNITFDSMNLSWDVGIGADKTVIVMKQGSYPSHQTDGSVFDCYDNWELIDGLLPNVTYYFRLWSYNDSESFYSTDYIQDNAKTFVGPPIVDTLSAINIENTEATLRGILTDGRGENCTIGFRWGSSPGVYTYNITKGVYSTGNTITHDISSLSKGNTYYYQCWAENQVGWEAGEEISFSTRPVEPNSFIATRYGARQINLSWVNGQGADRVRILKKMDSYPNSTSDGLLVFFGTGTFYADVPLTENTTWYYSIWSYNNTNGLYSTDFDSNYAKTGFLPNITFMSPCGELNVERPPLLQGMAEGDYPFLTYTFYGFYGYAPKILGASAMADPLIYGMGWTNPNNILSYDGYSSYYKIDYSKKWGDPAGIYYGSWIEASFDDAFSRPAPQLITGIYIEYSPITAVQVSFHDYNTDTWSTYSSGDRYNPCTKKYWELPSPTNVDAVRIRFGEYATFHDSRVVISANLKYVEFILEPELIYTNTVASGTLDDCVWNNAITGSKYHSWMLEVYDGIDYLFNVNNISTADVDAIYNWCNFQTEGVVISSPTPYDGESNLMPLDARICSAQINHTAGATMNITFSYYDGENWQIGGQNLSVGNGTYQWIFPYCNENYKTYYWNLSVWDGLYYHNESYLFKTRPVPAPPNFNLMNYNATVVNITGISGDERTDIIMIRAKKGSYPSNREDGDLLFNASLTEYLHVGLDPNTYYYYRAWSYNVTDEIWGSYTSKNIQTLGPQSPSFNLSKYNKSIINITGITINDAYSDTILIKAKIGSYPTDRTDGIFVVNTSSSSYDHTDLIQTTHYYYRAWAYDADTNWWSTPTDKNQKTNGPPTTSGFYPSNNQIISGVNPTLSVVIGEYNPTDTVTVYFRTNASGTWTTISTQSALPKTFTYKTSQFFYQDYDYWWCVNATDGEFWVNTTLKFTTGSMDVPGVNATTYNTSQINLSWTRAEDTTHTWIQRKIDEYPINRTDGINVYFGTGEYFEDTGLESGELYRYRIWSYYDVTAVFSKDSNTSQNVTKPQAPIDFTSTKIGYRSINLSWTMGEGAQKTVIVYKPDSYPITRVDGTEIYRNNGTWHLATDLKPDDYLNYYSPLPGTDNFGVYGGGDPFENSCDNNINTKWDLKRATTGNFSYELGIEPQRIKGFALFCQDFYEDPGTDWEAAITDFEVYNGSWHHDWNGMIVNTNTSPQWHYYESPTYYDDATEVRFSAWTEWITPNLYEVYVGKLGHVHCFRAWSVVTKEGITQYSDSYDSTENRTDDTPPNNIPEISNMNPINETINLNPNPTFNVTILDKEGDMMNISWQYLHNDNWIEFGQTTSVGNGTHIKTTTGTFIEFEKTYYWRVVVEDDADIGDSAIQENTNTSGVYWFTIREMSIPDDPTSFSAEAYLWHQINLTWTFTSDAVYIERNTFENWELGNGTFVYQGISNYFNDTNVWGDTTYYYQIWGYNLTDSSYSLNFLSANATTDPSPNDPPYAPFDGYVTSPVSSDETYLNVYDITMHCTVVDPDGDNMDVSFYWGNDTLIGMVYDVANNTEAELLLPDHWSRKILGYDVSWVEHNTTYDWYAVADDSEFTTQSNETWDFHTCIAWDLNVDRIINYLDISLLVSRYLRTVIPPGNEPADINEDGLVNYLDVSTLVANYLKTYY